MYTQIVTPAGTRQETGYVLVVMLVVSLGFGFLVVHRTRPEKSTQLETYQLSAYSDLNSFEQGTFSDLYTAALEIDDMHDLDDAWPQISDLEQLYLAPFLKDAVWERRGKLTWSVKNSDQPTLHVAAYIGTTSDVKASGSFLLLLSHHHDEEEVEQYETHVEEEEEEHCTIWYASGNSLTIPKDLIEQNLIAKGWKEVIPYKGKEEIQRLKGSAM